MGKIGGLVVTHSQLVQLFNLCRDRVGTEEEPGFHSGRRCKAKRRQGYESGSRFVVSAIRHQSL